MRRKIEPIEKIPESKINVSNENEVNKKRDPSKFYPSGELLQKNLEDNAPDTSSKEEKEVASSEQEKVPLIQNPKWGWAIAGVFIFLLMITVPKALSTIHSLGENKENQTQNNNNNNNNNNTSEGNNNNLNNNENNSNSAKNKLDSIMKKDEGNFTESDQNNREEIQNKREVESQSQSSVEQLNVKIINNLSSLSTALQNQTSGNQIQFGIQKDKYNVTLSSLENEYDKMVANREMTQAQADILGEKLNISRSVIKDYNSKDMDNTIEMFNDYVEKFNALEDQFQNLK